MVDIATGQVPDTIEDGKDEGAASLGRKGGVARAAKMTPEARSEAARKAVAKRWQK